ncbi:MAG: hypothetical protein UV73_C0012G0036 [Candidatus Gottesmanbacteria bacterium GW2011_GWA2_43_14]|uniref:DUF4349 domain-containing protein n=1 Tax=Candidatus Gottesmanbacteria bacterium GW2011_GWA2_43_14 TaxID=1618443 RepID=A0A0G1GAM3_9BACT|nr:MAG: hypothetical protein UV73_C0012G0036 [Candidatus Gottesmanbacteria bacterium GW2011_GWA2_43_14]
MKAVFSWIKNNRLTALLAVAVLYFLLKNNSGLFSVNLRKSYQPNLGMTESFDMAAPEMGLGSRGLGKSIIPSSADYAPTNNAQDRLVIQNSDISLQVKNVRTALDDILSQVKAAGGYMVNSSLSSPEDAPYASLTVRVPASQLDATLNSLRGLAVKVVWENLYGNDVTDEYEDIDAKLVTLNRTKAKFEAIFESAVEISDILRVQQELINLENQIDSYKGRQNYLEKNAQLARITINLSTDEFSLPYAPSETWRPDVIFKTAVRSLIANLRKVGTLAIWAFVYSVIIIPAILILRFFFRKKELQK